MLEMEEKKSINARDELGDKIDKLKVMMSRLAAKDSYEKRPFKPQIYKSRDQSRSYNQRGYQNRGSKSDSRNRGQYGNNRPRQNYRDNNFQRNTRGYGRQNNREENRDNRHNEYNRGRDRSRERTFQGTIVTIEIEVQVTVDQDQDLKLVLIGIE